MKIGFIGFGRMGSALALGAVKARALQLGQILVFDVAEPTRRHARKNKISVSASVGELVGRCDVIFLCVKPQGMRTLLQDIVGSLAHPSLKKKCFVSIAAGVSLETLQTILGRGVPVLRVMPNTPALLQSGMSGFSRGRQVSARYIKVVESILTSVGDVLSVPDSQMHAVTAVSGSGPAYVFYLAEALIEAGTQLGLSPAVAERLVRQTLYGAGQMLRQSSASAAELRRQVTSPGGTAEAALQEFERGRFRPLVSRALQKAARRSKILSQAI